MKGLKCEQIIFRGKWRCNLMALSGQTLCEKHSLMVQRYRENKNCGVSGEGVKRKCVDEGKTRGFDGDVSDLGGFVVGESSGVKTIGRPKGSGSRAKIEVVEKNVGGVRRRGRPPKGIRNEAKTKIVGESSSVDERNKMNKKKSKVVEENGGGVKRRGRPPKGTKNEDKTKVVEKNGSGVKRRGRPPKDTKNEAKIKIVGENGGVDESVRRNKGKTNVVEENGIGMKRRGKPPKSSKNEAKIEGFWRKRGCRKEW